MSKHFQRGTLQNSCFFTAFSYVIPWERRETEAIKENLEYHPLWPCCLGFQTITQVWSVAVPDDWALHTATSPWHLDETALKWEGLSSQSTCCTNARGSLSTSLHQSVSAALPVWHQLPSLLGTTSWLCWWLTCGTVAEEPPLSLCLSHTDTRSEPRNTSWLRELFWLNCPLRQPRVLKLVWDEVSWTEPRAWAGSQKGQLCPYHELLWAVPTVRVI